MNLFLDAFGLHESVEWMGWKENEWKPPERALREVKGGYGGLYSSGSGVGVETVISDNVEAEGGEVLVSIPHVSNTSLCISITTGDWVFALEEQLGTD